MMNAVQRLRMRAVHAESKCRFGDAEDMRDAADEIERLLTEPAAIAAEARRYASHYPQSSDGRNTFILLAEWIEARATAGPVPVEKERKA